MLFILLNSEEIDFRRLLAATNSVQHATSPTGTGHCGTSAGGTRADARNRGGERQDGKFS